MIIIKNNTIFYKGYNLSYIKTGNTYKGTSSGTDFEAQSLTELIKKFTEFINLIDIT